MRERGRRGEGETRRRGERKLSTWAKLIEHLVEVGMHARGKRQEATENIINLIVILGFYVSLIVFGNQDKLTI
jgi:hypothetical protein